MPIYQIALFILGSCFLSGTVAAIVFGNSIAQDHSVTSATLFALLAGAIMGAPLLCLLKVCDVHYSSKANSKRSDG